MKDLLPLLEQVAEAGQAARSSSPRTSTARRSPRSSSTSSAARSRSCAVKAPGFGDRRKEMLKDIAILTGGQVDHRGPRPQARERSRCKDLGRAKRITIDKDNTTIVDGAGKKADIEGARRSRSASRSRTPPATTTARSSRSASPSSSAASRSIKVGAATETEMKEKKARVEDALHATRAAVEEGIVPGGGVALIRAQHGAREAQALGDEQHVRRQHRPPRARGAAPPDRAERAASKARSSVRRSRRARARSASTPRPTSTRTSSRPASSTRPRSCARRCRTRRRVAALMLTTEALDRRAARRRSRRPPAAAAAAAAWVAWAAWAAWAAWGCKQSRFPIAFVAIRKGPWGNPGPFSFGRGANRVSLGANRLSFAGGAPPRCISVRGMASLRFAFVARARSF